MAFSLLRPLYGGGFGPALAQVCAFYYATGALLHWVVPAIFPVHNIQPIHRKEGVVARDALYSLGPLVVKAAIWTLVEALHARGLTRLNTNPITTPLQALYCLFVVALLDVLHDTWFYWTHRLLHWGPLYRHIHYIHHKSTVPCAFTGYSFHVVEAIIVFANEVLVCWLMPMHMGLHRVYHIFTTAIHEGGHVGYEIAPFIPSVEGLFVLAMRGWRKHTPALNTVKHHDMHHRFPTRHFSLYFTHWDRWCATMHPKYLEDLFCYFDPPTSAALPDDKQDKSIHGKEAIGNEEKVAATSNRALVHRYQGGKGADPACGQPVTSQPVTRLPTSLSPACTSLSPGKGADPAWGQEEEDGLLEGEGRCGLEAQGSSSASPRR